MASWLNRDLAMPRADGHEPSPRGTLASDAIQLACVQLSHAQRECACITIEIAECGDEARASLDERLIEILRRRALATRHLLTLPSRSVDDTLAKCSALLRLHDDVGHQSPDLTSMAFEVLSEFCRHHEQGSDIRTSLPRASQAYHGRRGRWLSRLLSPNSTGFGPPCSCGKLDADAHSQGAPTL